MALLPDLSTMKLDDEREGEEQYADPQEVAALEEDMAGAMALNEQLKLMLAQAEEAERMRQQQQSHAQHTRQQGSQSLMRGAAPRSGVSNNMRQLGHAKNGGWGGLTHTESRTNEIERDNQILVQKLTSIAVKPTRNTRQNVPFRQNQNTTSVAINRRRQDDKIARENAALARRLNSVKPTANLSNKSAAQHAAKHQSYLRTLAGGGNAMMRNGGAAVPAVPRVCSNGSRPSSTQGMPRLLQPQRPFT